MADNPISFITILKNNITKVLKNLIKIKKETLTDIYERLNEEIKLRGGYQSITKFEVNTDELNNDTNKKATVNYFNDAMQTRPYIVNNNQNNLYENSELDVNRENDYYKENKEE